MPKPDHTVLYGHSLAFHVIGLLYNAHITEQPVKCTTVAQSILLKHQIIRDQLGSRDYQLYMSRVRNLIAKYHKAGLIEKIYERHQTNHNQILILK